MTGSLFERETDKLDRMRPLRPRQLAAITGIKDAIREGHKRIILQAPTGFGKTLTAAHIIAAALKKNSRPLFTCPAISLVDQTLAAFEAEGIHDIGVIQAQHERTDYRATVQIASVQTLIRRSCPEVGFALIDEVHEQFDGLDALLDSPAWKDKIVIGLSATPWAKGMGNRWTKLVIAGTINDMIAEGHACPAIVYGPETDLNRDALAVERGEFVDKSAGEAMSDVSIIGDVIKEWKEKSPREKTFAFCVNRDHAKQQMDAFTDCGIPFGYIDALVDGDERKRIFHQMKYGEIAGIVSVGCLIRGVDEDVRCILDLQPTKSEMRHVQKWGRGVRMAEGKTCIARESLVLTQYGLVKIQDITLDHYVWDGVDWVSHQGAVCRGIKPVIEHDGIIGTPDHEVMTDDGFQELAEAKRRQARIVTTGIGGKPIRIAGDHISENNGRWKLQPPRRSPMFALHGDSLGEVLQHSEEATDGSMSALQSERTKEIDWHTEMAFREVRSSEGEVSESARHPLPVLRWEGNPVSIRRAERSGEMDCGELRDKAPIIRDRSHQQRWSLRAGEPAMGYALEANEQHSPLGWFEEAAHNRIQSQVSSRSIFGSDSIASHGTIHGRADSCQMGYAVVQAEREVWDILSAGPLQRFTVNGKLVHNCLLGLDHAGNNAALGLFTDIFHDTLDTRKPGERGEAYKDDAKPAKPRKCSKCHNLVPPGVRNCPTCHERLPLHSGVTMKDGRLVEIGSLPKVDKDQQRFYSELLTVARKAGYKEGWASFKFQAKFGVMPKGLKKRGKTEISDDVKQFVKEQRQAYLEAKAAAQSAARSQEVA